MDIRVCRIFVSFVALLALFIAVALTIVAVTTPYWQVANMEQVNQIRVIGLYQSCAYAYRQGSSQLPAWICTFIPFRQIGQLQIQKIMDPASRHVEVDYTALGGERKNKRLE